MTTMAEWNVDIARSIERGKASKAAYASGERRHWYFIHTDYCPVCGRDDTSRERVYGISPDDPQERRAFHESYDWCDQ